MRLYCYELVSTCLATATDFVIWGFFIINVCSYSGQDLRLDRGPAVLYYDICSRLVGIIHRY